MIIFLYGPDSYRRQKKQQWIVAEYALKHSALTIERFDIEKINDGEEDAVWGRLRDFIKNQSIFDTYKLAIVRGVHFIVDDKEKVTWLKSLHDISGVVFLIIADSAPSKKLSFLIEKPTVFFDEFKMLEGFEFKKFVEEEATHRGARLSASQLAELGALYRNDMWGLVTELDKLALASNFQFTNSNFQLRKDFFTLAKILAYGRSNEKLSALEELLYSEDSAKTFNMLAALVSGEEKIQMADYDVAVKSGIMDYEVALLSFAIR